MTTAQGRLWIDARGYPHATFDEPLALLGPFLEAEAGTPAACDRLTALLAAPQAPIDYAGQGFLMWSDGAGPVSIALIGEEDDLITIEADDLREWVARFRALLPQGA